MKLVILLYYYKVTVPRPSPPHRSTILRVLGELGWRVRELVGFHVRHALTAVRRQGAGAMEGEMAGEGAEGEPFR